MKEKMTRIAGMAVALGLMVLGAACGNQAAATTMKLAGTEGETFVRNEEKELEPVADMNLYSGYLLGTEQEGYLWIDLDRWTRTAGSASGSQERSWRSNWMRGACSFR